MPPELAQKWLAYSRGPAFASNIYISRADGTDQFQVTNGPGDRYNAVWSPDGARLLYRVEGPEGADVDPERDGNWIVDADGTNNYSLTAATGLMGHGVSQPWAPDGQHVAIAAGQPSQIWVMRVDGSEARALTPPTFEAQYAAWSPDGTRIAFAAVEDGSFRVYLMAADGTDIKPVTDGPEDNWPMWSPDGSQIAFSRAGGLAVMNSDGSGVSDVVPGAFGGVPAAWAPGDMLAFNCSVDADTIGICARESDGTYLALLGGLDAGFPSWRPTLPSN